MKKIKNFLAISLMGVAMISLPFVSFANDDDRADKDRNYKAEAKIEHKSNLKIGKDSDSGRDSFFSRIFGFFGTRAKAETLSRVEVKPVISSFSAKVGDNGVNRATLEWKTDVRATSSVWYSTNPSVDTLGSPNIYRRGKVLNHKINLNNLKAGTTYYVVVASSNDGGVTKSSETSFTTLSKENKAPIISRIRIGIESATEVLISWKTNEPSTSKVFYSKTSPVDSTSSGAKFVSDGSMKVEHSLKVGDLTADANNYFVIESKDEAGNISASSEFMLNI